MPTAIPAFIADHRRALTVAAVGAGVLGAAALAVQVMARRAEARHRPSGRFVSVGTRKLHVVERGQGSPVILLHGNGATVDELAASGLLDRLSQDYRVIVPDRPGFGWSDRAERGWTPEKEAGVILDLIGALNLERPVIVAHSWATLVALSAALEKPDAVSGLVLVGGYYYPSLRGDVLLQSVVAAPVLGDLLRHTVWPLIARVSAPAAFKRVFWPRRPTRRFLAEYPVGMAARPSQLRSVADDTVELPRAAARLQRRYRELLLPVDIVAGEGDSMVKTASQSRRLERELRSSFFDQVPGAGHMVHHHHPELVAQRVGHVFGRALKPLAKEQLPEGRRSAVR